MLEVHPESTSSEEITAGIPNISNTGQLLGYMTVKWLPLLATHPTWFSFGGVSDSKPGAGEFDWQSYLTSGAVPSSGGHWANAFRLHVRRKQVISHLLDDLLNHKDFRCLATKRNPEISTTFSKCGLFGSTESNKTRKLLSWRTCKKMTTNPDLTKNMKMNDQRQGFVSSSPDHCDYSVWPELEGRRGLFWPQFQQMKPIFTVRQSEWGQGPLFWWESVAWFVTTWRVRLVLKGPTHSETPAPGLTTSRESVTH